MGPEAGTVGGPRPGRGEGRETATRRDRGRRTATPWGRGAVPRDRGGWAKREIFGRGDTSAKPTVELTRSLAERHCTANTVPKIRPWVGVWLVETVNKSFGSEWKKRRPTEGRGGF